MNADYVAACIVTRGDCDLTPILESLIFDQVVIWDNSAERDLGAYGRYQAIFRTWKPIIYVQDDDCIVPPAEQQRLLDGYEEGRLTAMMPRERTDYTDTVLIGWGAIFDWKLPFRAFRRWYDAGHSRDSEEFYVVGADFVFPMLSRWKRLDGEHVDLPHAHAANRTWASWPNYATVKDWYLRAAREIRDA